VNLVVSVSLAVVILLCALATLVWNVVSATRVRGVDPDWLKSFSVDSYRPMARLLSEDDIRFLKTQPGYRPGMEKALRSSRRKIFRAYLRSLGQDFNRLHLALRLAVLWRPEDAPELAKKLLWQKAVFFGGLLAVHLRLLLYTAGIGTVNAGNLILTIEKMRADLLGMMEIPAMQPAA